MIFKLFKFLFSQLGPEYKAQSKVSGIGRRNADDAAPRAPRSVGGRCVHANVKPHHLQLSPPRRPIGSYRVKSQVSLITMTCSYRHRHARSDHVGGFCFFGLFQQFAGSSTEQLSMNWKIKWALNALRKINNRNDRNHYLLQRIFFKV